MRALAEQFLRFAGVGAVATGAHYAVLVGLVEGLGRGVLAASAVGAAVGAGVSYALNRRYTFGSARAHREAAPRFLAVAALAFLANLALMALVYGWAGAPYLLAQGVTTALVLGITFTLNRAWSFAAGPISDPPPDPAPDPGSERE